MKQFEEDLELAKNLVSIITAAETGKMLPGMVIDNKRQPNITFNTPYGHFNYAKPISMYYNNLIWDEGLIQIELSSTVVITGDDVEHDLYSFPESEESYFQNSLIHEPFLHTWNTIVSYLIKNLDGTNIKSITIYQDDIKEVVNWIMTEMEKLNDTI